MDNPFAQYSQRYFSHNEWFRISTPVVETSNAESSAKEENRAVSNLAPATLDGRLNLSTREVQNAIGSIRLFQRLRAAGWIKALFPSRDSLYPASQIIAAQRRMEEGERPPLLPSEIRSRLRSRLVATGSQ